MVRSMTLRSVKSAMAWAWPGVSSGSKISTSASNCMARTSTSSSLPRPTRYLGSGSGRRCSIDVADDDAGGPAQLAQLGHPALHRHADVRPGPAARLAPGLTTTSSARSAPAVATVVGTTRSNSSSSASSSSATSSSARWKGTAGKHRPGDALVVVGARWATCRSAGRPSRVTPTAATRSSRSSARSTRSSRVSASLRRWVCTRRRPRKRPAAGAQAADLGHVDARGVADEDVLDLPAPADQHPHLPLDFPGEAAQVAGQLGRHDLGGVDPPAVDALQRLDLAGLEAGEVSGELVHRARSRRARTCASAGSRCSLAGSAWTAAGRGGRVGAPGGCGGGRGRSRPRRRLARPAPRRGRPAGCRATARARLARSTIFSSVRSFW